MSWQLPVAILIIVAAALYLTRRTWLSLTARKAGGCAGCGGATSSSAEQAQRVLIPEDQITLRLRDPNGSSPPSPPVLPDKPAVYRIAIVDPVTPTRQALIEALHGMQSIELAACCSQYCSFLELVRQTNPDAVIVAFDPDPPAALRVIDQLRTEHGRLVVIAASILGANRTRLDATLVPDLQRRAGHHLKYPPDPLEVLIVLEAASKRRFGSVRESMSNPTPQEAEQIQEIAKNIAKKSGPERASLSQPERIITTDRVKLPAQPIVAGPAQSGSSAGDQVVCTVFAPPAAAPGETVFVQVFAHLPEQVEIAREHATEFDAAAARRGFRSLEAEVERGAKLTFHLVMPGAKVDYPAVQELYWRGVPEGVQFGVRVSSHRDPGCLVGTVTISREGVPLGHVKFKLAIAEAAQPAARDSLAPVGEDARRYRKAFVSYASPDRTEVLKRVQMLGRLGIDYFQDVLKLEPGQRWEQQLYRHIGDCDLFLLFWSTAARQSEWVNKELRYALELKGDDDHKPPEIQPVVIEGPPPPAPPLELAHLHFNDYLLYFMTRPS
jgi:hypothetical protein